MMDSSGPASMNVYRASPVPLPSLHVTQYLSHHPSVQPVLHLVPRRLGIGGGAGGGGGGGASGSGHASPSGSHKRSASVMESHSPSSPSMHAHFHSGMGGLSPHHHSHLFSPHHAASSPFGASTPSASGFDVLLVEDVRVAQRIAARALQSAGYRVDVASSGEAAVERFKLHADSLRIVLMDINLPGMSGVEATEAIRAWERQWLAASTRRNSSSNSSSSVAAGGDGSAAGADATMLPAGSGLLAPPSLISAVALAKSPVVIFGLTGNTESGNLRLYEQSGMNGCISKGSILGHAVRAAMESVSRNPGMFIHLSGSSTQHHASSSAAAAGLITATIHPAALPASAATTSALSPASSSTLSTSNSPLPMLRLTSNASLPGSGGGGGGGEGGGRGISRSGGLGSAGHGMMCDGCSSCETTGQCRCATTCGCSCACCTCSNDRASECSTSSKRARLSEPEGSNPAGTGQQRASENQDDNMQT